MRTDSVAAIQGSLGTIEDELAQMQHWYSEAAGWMAWWEHIHRARYLETRDVLKDQGIWDAKTTETQKRDDIERALQIAYPTDYEKLREQAKIKAAGDKLFQSLDARRSIGQTLMKPHMVSPPQFGQEAYGQSGLREPA
jgi:hypothetical protein